MLKTLPYLSVIIPTYQRPKPLEMCLGAFCEIDYPRDRFEVIIVDDGSQTSMEPVIAPFREQLNLIFLRQTNAGPATARNTGAAHAQGQFLAFTDDDCAPDPAWLRVMAEYLQLTPNHMVGGHSVNALDDNLYSTASQQLITYLYLYYGDESGKAQFFTSNNMAMSAELFKEVGMFDTTFPLAAGEDREFCDRWKNRGYKMTYAPEAVIHHAHGLSLRKFWRQHFNYGRGAYHFHKLRALRDQERIKIEPSSFYINLLRHPFSQTSGARALWVGALLLMSQGANTAGFFWEKLNRTQD